jgi:hypothetical protein
MATDAEMRAAETDYLVRLIRQMADLLDDSRCRHVNVDVRTHYLMRKQRALKEAREVTDATSTTSEP